MIFGCMDNFIEVWHKQFSEKKEDCRLFRNLKDGGFVVHVQFFKSFFKALQIKEIYLILM